MLSEKPTNLNIISKNAAKSMIEELLHKKYNVTNVYIDTIGQPEKYQA